MAMASAAEAASKAATASTATAEPAISQQQALLNAATLQAETTLHAASIQAATALKAAQTTAGIAIVVALLSLGGALIAALVAWRNAHIQSVTTEQMKLADFRQAWIDKLRAEFARYARLAIQNDGTAERRGELHESMFMILFLMDWRDPDYEELKLEMETIADGKRVTDDRTEAFAYFSLIGQDILKREWGVTQSDLRDRPPPWPFDGEDKKRRKAKQEARQQANEKRRAQYRASRAEDQAKAATAAAAAATTAALPSSNGRRRGAPKS